MQQGRLNSKYRVRAGLGKKDFSRRQVERTIFCFFGGGILFLFFLDGAAGMSKGGRAGNYRACLEASGSPILFLNLSILGA